MGRSQGGIGPVRACMKVRRGNKSDSRVAEEIIYHSLSTQRTLEEAIKVAT